MQLSNWLKKQGPVIAAFLLITFVVINAGLIFSIKNKIADLETQTAKAQRITSKAQIFTKNAARLDMAIRDYLILGQKSSLDRYETSLAEVKRNYDTLAYQLQDRAHTDSLMRYLSSETRPAIGSHQTMLAAIKQGDSALIKSQFNTLPALMSETFIDNINQQQRNANKISTLLNQQINTSALLQILCLASAPFLIFLAVKLNKQRKYLTMLNRDIEESNQKYVFNPMDSVDYENTAEVKARLLNNLKKAANFIQQVSSGNYDVRWEGMNDTNKEANKENIAGELIRMREQMKHVKEQDRIRIWVTEGLSKFGEIIRKQQDNFTVLSDTLISNVVKYVDAKVGGLFILEEQNGGQYLNLAACYAYDRKKFIVKKINVGEGLVGQAYLEGHTIYLKEVPQGYMSITSGLGNSTPRTLLVVPLKTNDKIEGILELASLREFQPYEIEFLEKLAESLASSIISIRSGEKTKILLQTSQEQAEQMRAQEEEVRQNMEELEATQEQMHRQMNELNELKESLEKEKYLFSALMENIPDNIYFKDRDCKLIRVSKYMVTQFGGSIDQLIGKSDFDFHDEEHAREAYEDEQNIMRTRQPKIDYIEKETKEDGTELWVSTTKMPLVNLNGEVVGTFGISRNVTTFKRLELDVMKKDELLKEKEKIFQDKIKSLEQELKEKQEQLAKLPTK